VDYKKIMDGQKTSFGSLYDEVIERILEDSEIDSTCRGLLRERRDMGKKKYGKYSMQTNLTNCLKVPIVEHIKEELLDLMNYYAHLIYIGYLMGEPWKQPIKNCLETIDTFYRQTSILERTVKNRIKELNLDSSVGLSEVAEEMKK